MDGGSRAGVYQEVTGCGGVCSSNSGGAGAGHFRGGDGVGRITDHRGQWTRDVAGGLTGGGGGFGDMAKGEVRRRRRRDGGRRWDPAGVRGDMGDTE